MEDKVSFIYPFFLGYFKINPLAMIQKNVISWFEIPATDIQRAQKFYETVLEVKLTPLDQETFTMRMFPTSDPQGVAGTLIHSEEFYKPSGTDGPLVYLNANPDIQKILDKVEQAGGKILQPKTQISPEYGYMALILDTEGNRIAFHSMEQG